MIVASRFGRRGEEPIDVLRIPYQSRKGQLHMMATRARNKAEWCRSTTTRMTTGLREIDREASQIDKHLNDLEQGIVRTAMMGGTMAKQEISKFNENVDGECN